jgi:hypothetical protein
MASLTVAIDEPPEDAPALTEKAVSSATKSSEDIVAALQAASLSGDRMNLLSTLEEYKAHLQCIPLAPPQVCGVSQAVKDVLRERLVLNGVRFLGQGSLFLETLRRLAQQLCSYESVKGSAGDPSGSFVVDAILTRCARTTSGFDSYNTVLQLLQCPEMLLKPRPGALPPIDIELFVTGGSVHCAVSSTNMYGFYRFEDIEAWGNRMSEPGGAHGGRDSGGESGGAWLSVDTVVVEKIDFRTGRSLRFLRIEVPDRLSEALGS